MSLIKHDQWQIFWQYGSNPHQQKNVGDGYGQTAEEAIQDFVTHSEAQCRKGQVPYQREGLVARRVEVKKFNFQSLPRKTKPRRPSLDIGQRIADWPARRANEVEPFIPR